jgi:hypothetical protein
MLAGNALVQVSEVKELPGGLTSAIGHADTAKILGVECNRINVTLNSGDVAYVAQLQGGRLPEGATTLPEGFSFKYMKVAVWSFDDIYDLAKSCTCEGLTDALSMADSLTGSYRGLNSIFPIR